jgi:predicted nucleotide-binding protein
MAKYNRTLQDLQVLVLSLGHEGDWTPGANSVWRFVRRDRAGMNWSETTGTLWFDGPGPAKAALQASIESALVGDGTLKEFDPSGKTIFVVHGRDHTSRDQLQLVLFKLGLQPFVLQDTGGGGKTIIEALEKMIGKKPASAFGIVLLTPDDMGYLKEDGTAEAKPRARQNVILELGMLLSSLTRERVAILQKGIVELPSNLDGVLYLPFNDHVKYVIPKLVQRLQDAGFRLDPTKIAEAST